MATTPLPNLPTPQAFKDFFNAHINGGKPVGGPSAQWKGATVGDQWLAFYADAKAKEGSSHSLYDYAAAFLAWATLGLTNTDLQAGITGGAQTAAQLGVGAAQGALSLYQNSILGFLGKLSDANLWLRIMEVGLGVVLIAVGLARMTNAVPIATSIAKAVK